MAKAIRVYAGGKNDLVQCAVRGDGMVFKRRESDTPYGKRWSSWRQSVRVDASNLPAYMVVGLATCVPREKTVRLPNF